MEVEAATLVETCGEVRIPHTPASLVRSRGRGAFSLGFHWRKHGLDYVLGDRDRLAPFDDDWQCCTLPRLPSRFALAAKLIDVVSGGHEIPMMTTLADGPTMRADPLSGSPIVSRTGESDFILKNSTIGAQENITVVLLSARPFIYSCGQMEARLHMHLCMLGAAVVSGCLAQNSTIGILLAHARSTAV